MEVGITASAFDFLHAGHVVMLKEAKEQCDHLIVALHVDPSKENVNKKKPAQTLVERYIQLKGCKYVDEIIPYETEQDLIDILTTIDVHVRIIGVEYKDKNFTGLVACKSLGIRIHYNSRNHRFSSSALREGTR